MFRNRHRDQQRNMGVMLLAMQLLNSGPIPPVTLSAILLQMAIYMGFVPNLGLSKTRNMCLIPSRVLGNGEWWRLLAPVIMHGDDMHLYYNMISLLYKGRKLEKRLGSIRFASILAVFTIASTVMTVAVSYGLDLFFDAGYMYQCAVGFSGVLFALKVLMNNYFPSNQYLLGIPLPISGKYACWAELLLIQMITPNASFIGHLAGILVGLLYTFGPLKWIADFLAETIGLAGIQGNPGQNFEPTAPPANEDEEEYSRPYAGTFSGRGATTGGSRNRYDDYTGGLSEEEQMRRAMDESMRQRRGNYEPSAPFGWR